MNLRLVLWLAQLPCSQWLSGTNSFPFFPTRQEGVVRFYVGIRVCDASTPRPHPVSRQSRSPVDPAKYSARVAREWIRLSTHQKSPPVDPAEYPRVARQWIPPSSPLSIPCQWILPSIRPVSSRSGCGSRQYPARAARRVCLMSRPAHSWVYISCWYLRGLSVP